jgi:hypothetical protein
MSGFKARDVKPHSKYRDDSAFAALLMTKLSPSVSVEWRAATLIIFSELE